MKRMPLVLATLAILSIFLISPVAAANNQGLSWAIASGDVFNYTFAGEIPNEAPLSESIILRITNNPTEPPDDITNMAQIPTVTGQWRFANDTDASSYIYGIDFFAVPIGNYSLLSTLVEDEALPGYEEINDVAFWGYKARTAFFDPEIQLRLEIKYQKSDGILSLADINFYNTTSSSSVAGITLTRQGGDILSLIMDNILYVGIGVGVIIILGAVVCIRRK